jgi:hypothetical protein
MAAGTSVVTVGLTYVSLGTGPMLIDPNGPVQIIAATSQPLASVVGHDLSALDTTEPFYFPLALQVWAIAQQVGTSVTVTATS